MSKWYQAAKGHPSGVLLAVQILGILEHWTLNTPPTETISARRCQTSRVVRAL